MNTNKSPTLYHNGVIDVFKLCKIYELNIVNIKKKGDVTCEMV